MVTGKTRGSVWRRKRVGLGDEDKMGLGHHIISSKKRTAAIDDDNRNKGEKYYPLLSYHQLPDYMKDNEYILDYYRADWPIKQALFSLFSWHNETLNVWTHLLGFLLFVGLTVSNLVDVPQVVDLITEQFPSSAESNISNNLSLGGPAKWVVDVNPPECGSTRWPFLVFLCGAMFCLLSSTACHLFSCHSRRLSAQLLHADYLGITVMIITSFFPPIYYVFHRQPWWRLLYLGCITAMGGCTIAALLSSVTCHRTFLFVSMGLSGVVPAAHALVLNWDDPSRNVILAYEAGMAVSYLVGTGFYVARVPERWRPGWFDLAGHSHQIFHVLVVAGAVAHYGAARVFLVYGCGAVA